MKKIPIGTKVFVDGPANQWPFERIVDDGVILDNRKGYLVKLKTLRENLMFHRCDLTVLNGRTLRIIPK